MQNIHPEHPYSFTDKGDYIEMGIICDEANRYIGATHRVLAKILYNKRTGNKKKIVYTGF